MELRCNVGDTIYRCGKKIWEWEVTSIEIYADEIVYIDDSGNPFTAEDIGKTVFLTRKDAEEALKTKLTTIQMKICKALPANNLNVSQAAKSLYMERTGVVYHIDKIKETIGLDPRGFYDLIALLEMRHE
jgi:hypothetical protein